MFRPVPTHPGKNRAGSAGRNILLLLLLAGVAGASFYYFARNGRAGDSAAGSEAPPPPPEVAVVTIESSEVVLTTELPGRTSAFLVAEVRPQVGGLIQKRLFEEGADVHAGQPLYQIDPAPFEAALQNAQANLAGARNAAGQARAALQAGNAAVEQQGAVAGLARANRGRFEDLAEDGVISLQQRDQVVTEDQVAAATLRSAQARLASDREAIAVAESAIGQAEAAVETARINLGYTEITAPIDGRIGKSNVTVGALVTAHQPLPLSTIQQMDPIYVDVPQSTAELLRLRRRLESGQVDRQETGVANVQLLLEDDTPYPQEGTLQFRDVTVDQSTGSVTLRAVFPNPDGLLLPGMFVRAIITEGVNPGGILVPQQAVSRDHKGNPLVLLIGADGAVEERPLTLDRAIGDNWLASAGLRTGDRVIVEGMQRVRPGDKPKVVPFQEPAPAPSAVETGAR